MITPVKIRDAVEALLQEAFPGEPVYKNTVPLRFERPSSYVSCAAVSAATAGMDILELRFRLEIMTFVQTDERHDSDSDSLYLRAMKILALFAPGYIRVFDSDTASRCPKVGGVEIPETGLDYAKIQVTLTLTMSREELQEKNGDDGPLMETVAFRKTQ